MARKCLCLLTALGLWIACAFPAFAAGESAAVTPDDRYTLVAENQARVLYADRETGDFAVLNKQTGQLWFSGQWDVLNPDSPVSEQNSGRIKTDLVSVIAVKYVQISTISATAVPSYENSYAYSVNGGNATVSMIPNGIRTEYYFPDIETTVPVEITLTEDGFTAAIVGKELKVGEKYRIISISLLPGLMASDDRHQGYLLLPSGSGGIIPFASGKGELAEFSEMVYGEDTAIEAEEYTGDTGQVSLPVYGMKRDEEAIFAVIEKGDASARINAGADSLSTSFTYAYSEYVTAIVDSTTLFESNYENQRVIYGAEDRKTIREYQVRYTFLSGTDADYAGMARVYRERLNLGQKAAKPALALTLYGAGTRKASFLGIPYTKTVALTDFKQAQAILSDLDQSGVSSAFRFIGWNAGGIENKKIPATFSPIRVLGGKRAFKAWSKALEKSNQEYYFDLDWMTIRRSGNGFSVLSDVCRSIFNTRTPIYKYMRSVYVPVNTENPSFLLKSSKVKKAAETFLKKYPYAGGLSLDKIGERLYSDFSKKGCTREDTQAIFTEILKDTAKKHTVALSGANAYVLPYADRIYNLPTSHDGNLLFSQSVPFLQMVLHGHVAYSVRQGDSLLDCMEYGGDPAFAAIAAEDSGLIETPFNWLYGTTYSSRADQMKAVFAEYEQVYRTLYHRQMIGHDAENDFSVTEYEGGVKVAVNRGKTDRQWNGQTVAAGGFLVFGGVAE